MELKSALPVFRVKRNLKARHLQCNHSVDKESCNAITLQKKNLKLERIKQLFYPLVILQHQSRNEQVDSFLYLITTKIFEKGYCVPTPWMHSGHSWSHSILVSFLWVKPCLFMFLLNHGPPSGPNVTWPAEVIKTRPCDWTDKFLIQLLMGFHF